MSEPKFADNELFTSKDGREVRLATIKAQVGHSMASRHRNLLKNLSPEKKSAFYFRVYENFLKREMSEKQPPIFQIGLSPYTFLMEPLNINGVATSFGQLFERLHQALDETAQTMELVEK